MNRNGIFYALICINNHVLSCLISMVSNPPMMISNYICIMKHYSIYAKAMGLDPLQNSGSIDLIEH